jgi:L,D-peptidoglycan transpeptidase YkuD (ErfK/YbiS/YcfS/YnhG family)
MRRLGIVLAALLTVTMLVAPTGAQAKNTPVRAGVRSTAFATVVPADTTQVVRTISSHRWCRDVWCTVTQAWEKRDGTWTLLRQFRSTIGVRGWGKTHEGDMRSPVGVLRIAVTFSTSTRPGAMPWRRRDPSSIVSSAAGPNYNTWLEVPGVTSGDRPSMRWGWWTSYNNARLAPGKGPAPVQGKGSGIFYHTSKPGHPWEPTQGCTQVGNPASMHWLAHWLKPGADPRIVQDL